MTYDTFNETVQPRREDDEIPQAIPRGAPATAPLPPGLVWAERAVASFHAYLDRHDLSGYRVFYCEDLDLDDIDECLGALGESAAWEPAPPAVDAGRGLTLATHTSAAAKFHHAGFLRLDKARVAVARWFALDPEGYGSASFWLAAAPCAEAYHNLRQEVLRLRRARTGSQWTIVRGSPRRDEQAFSRRQGGGDELIMTDALRTRVEVDIVRFFSAEVAAMYRSLSVPYRRGVLLHGPPGNGKTSLIRQIGAAVGRVPGLILRPDAAFDSDALEEVLKRWRDLAPAILVIEDLDWLLEHVNVSTFLNLIDGIDGVATGGLLLIATTNHPEKLDPAVNNRPGRFDVTIEIPNPDDALRTRFFAHHLPAIAPGTVRELVSITHRLSFAHLHEILRLSGLMAIHAGRAERADADVLEAARSVRDSADDASKGFPVKLDVPFGLSSLRRPRS